MMTKEKLIQLLEGKEAKTVMIVKPDGKKVEIKTSFLMEIIDIIDLDECVGTYVRYINNEQTSQLVIDFFDN